VNRHLESRAALTPEQELVIYRVAQEALTNVVRHAHARSVDLALTCDQHRTVLTVDDDGRGLLPESLDSSSGIRGMRERAMLIGADLDIGVRAAGGTRVRLTVPHAHASR
jgi:two-component system sensor histidine kinase UhpB